MPDFQVVSESVAQLKAWSSELPPSGRIAADLPNRRVSFGDHHGSWVLTVLWEEDSLVRSAEIAITNAEALDDATADSAYISVRSSASGPNRFVQESIYDRRRSVRRLETDQLEGWLATAIQRARQYTTASLTVAYEMGTDESQSQA